MADSMEELEPLFDYRRVQPFNVVIVDDDPLDAPPVGCKKKRKTADSAVEENDNKGKVVQVIDCDENEEEEEEEDWLPPPPKMTNDTSKLNEDSTIKELRLKRQELASLAQSAKDALKAVEESVRQEFAAAESMKSHFNASSQSPTRGVAEQPSDTCQERAKIVITIQDKDGPKQFRVFMDDKFERLFKMYAEKVKLDLQNLVFCFDGDKISPTATPAGLEMEENDIIEVYVKRK
ncbi:uncharacterized protein [Coffea arabica]|uniref:NFATC2-interacting protein-like n=1 Tax=Coffea arabica TaxID=13443 RepID=A0A6P6V6Z8_COFAR|nr:NFATC2-interacting protein-like [Coffea arabica]XP_027098451.1 NFATC2-interacting protein-like [Coffea arabica]